MKARLGRAVADLQLRSSPRSRACACVRNPPPQQRRASLCAGALTLMRRALEWPTSNVGGKQMTRTLSIALAVVFLSFAANRAARAADQGPIRIGQVIPLTGEAAESG